MAHVSFSSPSPLPNNSVSMQNANSAGLSQQQQDFKTWFFQSAQHQQQQIESASKASSPRQIRRILRRAWKTLEKSPYYKTLRSESRGSQGDVTVDLKPHSRSLPNSPKGRKQRKSTLFKKASPKTRKIKSAKETASPEMKPSASSSTSKARPFSASSVGSTTSSEGSEVGHNEEQKLIPLSKRLFSSSKVRPKSSGILRNGAQPAPPPVEETPPGKIVAFNTVETTPKISATVTRRPSIPSKEGNEPGVVLDAANANADTAQLVTIQENPPSNAATKLFSKKFGKSSKPTPGLANLKIIDETVNKTVRAKSAVAGKKTTPSKAGSVSSVASSSTTTSTSKKPTDTQSKLLHLLGGAAQSQAAHHGSSSGSLAESTAKSSSPTKEVSKGSVSSTGTPNKEGSTSSHGAFNTQDSSLTDMSKTTDATEETSSKGSKEKSKEKPKKDGKEGKDSKSKESKSDKKSESKIKSDEAAKKSITSDGPTSTSSVSDKPAGSVGSAPGAEGEDDSKKAPLKREMSRISVKTNESRKSIDMSKHIMNLIHSGQNQEEQTKKPQTTNQSYIQQAIPALPMPAAVILLILNLFAPGVGTMISGFLCICIGKPRIEAKENAVGLTIFVNLFVGISQLMTVTFFFVGWFWSMVWGINMIINSVEYMAERRAEREKELQQTAMRAFGFIRADAAPAVDE